VPPSKERFSFKAPLLAKTSIAAARLEAKNSKGFSPFLAPALTATAASVGGSVLFDDKRAEAFGLLDGFYLIGSMMTRQQIPQPNFSGRLSQHGFAGSSDRYTDR
jgi:hypothetical protein